MGKGYRFAIHWELFLRVKTPQAAEKVLRRLSARIGRDVTPFHVERYWKLPELHSVRATTSLEADCVEPAIFEMLVACRGIGVTVSSPSEYGDGWWTVGGSGIGKGGSVPGVADLLGHEGVVSIGVGVGPRGWTYRIHLYVETSARDVEESELSPTGRTHPDDPNCGEILVEPRLGEMEGTAHGC
jgi:hypothetical protein